MSDGTPGMLIVGALLDESEAFGAAVPQANFDFWELPEGTSLPSVVLTRVSRTEQQFLAAEAKQMVTERIQATVRANSGAQREAILRTIRDGCRTKFGTIVGFEAAAVLLGGDGPDFKDADAAIYMGSTDLRVSFAEVAEA